MSKFEIKKGIDSILNKGGRSLVDIEFLGIGGAFDTEEGNASALLKTRSGKRLLIDCGYTAYSKLRKKELIDKIDVVFITHCHEDHINGLSTLIYERYYIHKMDTIIECTEAVGKKLEQYLEICGHPEEQFEIQTGNIFYDEDKISVTKIDTTAHHWPYPGFPNSGLLFHFDAAEDVGGNYAEDAEEDYAVVIYSGDINIPITDLMDEENYPFVYAKPDNVFIFHDMTSLVHEQNPHTNFELLIPVKEKFNNLFTYHHGAEQVALINQSNAKMASTSLVYQGNNLVIEEKMGL